MARLKNFLIISQPFLCYLHEVFSWLHIFVIGVIINDAPNEITCFFSASTISSYENERRTVSPRVRHWVNNMYRKHHLSKKVIKSARDNTLCAFMPQRCYSINDDDRIVHWHFSSFNLGYVFRYERTEGIHHCFREVRGGWSRTYTDWQLVDKRVLEMPYLSMACWL